MIGMAANAENFQICVPIIPSVSINVMHVEVLLTFLVGQDAPTVFTFPAGIAAHPSAYLPPIASVVVERSSVGVIGWPLDV